MTKILDDYARWVGLKPATQTEKDKTASARTILPCDPEKGVIILIYAVELFCGIPPNVSGAWSEAQIASVGKAVFVHDPEHVASHEIENIGKRGGVKEIQGGSSSLITYPEPFIYPFKEIYLTCQSHLTATTNNSQGRILCKRVRVSDEELREILER